MTVLFCTWSCKESEPAGDPPIESYNLVMSGDYQIGAAGEYLENEITLTYSPEAGLDASIEVHFEVTSGGGSVDAPNQILSAQAVVSTKWKTGTQTTQQTVTAHVYGKNRKLLTDLVYTSSALQPGKWDTVYYQRDPLESFLEMAKDPIHKRTYLIKGDQKLYVQGDHYSQWKLVESFKDKECTSIAVDSKGTLYAASGMELFKSVDQGASFAPCTNPCSDLLYLTNLFEHYAISIQIANNDHIWVNDILLDDIRISVGKRFSVDDGQTWIITDLGTNHMDIYILVDGSFITWNGNNIGQSIDGISWLSLSENLPQSINSMFVTGEDEIIVFCKGDMNKTGHPVIVYKSADLGATFSRVHTFDAQIPSAKVYCEKVKDGYYVYVDGMGIYKTNNFDTFETVLMSPLISGFMIDHTGAIFVDTHERGDRNEVAIRFYWKDKE